MQRLGIRTRKGRPYSKSAVQKILANPFYIGINRFQGKDHPGAQVPIIDRDLFERVQRKMHKGRPAVFKKHNPIFKNLISCKECGGMITWQRQKDRYYGNCQRLQEICRGRKLLREDRVEEVIVGMLKDLVCPSAEIIEWVADSMRQQYKASIEQHEKIAFSLQSQIDRISRMDDDLYEDKLAGEISKERYKDKHEQFIAQRIELEKQLKGLEKASGVRLEQKLVLLELSQKAAELYARKSPEQKRLIISKLFGKITAFDGSVSVTYTNFTYAIAEKVQKTIQLLGKEEN